MSLANAGRFAVIARLPVGVALAVSALAPAWAFESDQDRGGGPFELEAQVIAGGGTTTAASACFELDGTIGQPVVGRASGGAFVLEAGFWVAPFAGDLLFDNGFEIGECP